MYHFNYFYFFDLYWLLGATLGRELQEAILDILAGVESLAVTIIRHGSDWLVYTVTSS